MIAPTLITKEEKPADASFGAKGTKSTKKTLLPIDIDIKVGDSVTVTEGAFETMDATVSEINLETQRVEVMVSLFGRETPVELRFDQINKNEK
jgi:transcriptional antiterminator NusG